MAMTATHITVSVRERVCLNCKQYRRLLREVDVPDESYKALKPVSFGYCLLREQQRGALMKPCKEFKAKESPLFSSCQEERRNLS